MGFMMVGVEWDLTRNGVIQRDVPLEIPQRNGGFSSWKNQR